MLGFPFPAGREIRILTLDKSPRVRLKLIMVQGSCIAKAGRLLSAAVLVCLAPVLAFAQAGPACPSTPLVRLHLPHLRAALAARKEAVIVALGSSSTQGVMASDTAHTYPAVLQASLSQAIPEWHIAVLNRGIGGQDAAEELARLTSDVIAVHPQLVIWLVGANGAMRNANPDRFRQRVTQGVGELQAAGIDVVLMDNQHCPRVDATPEGVLLDHVLGQVAEQTHAGLFSRAAVMETWQREGVPELQFISSDGLHHNDRGYGCVARALARDIVTALEDSHHVTARR